MIQFTNPATAAKYETDYTSDPIVHLPGGKNKNGWKGRLSNLPVDQADRWIDRPGQNLIKLKGAAAPKEEIKAAAPKKKKEEDDQVLNN